MSIPPTVDHKPPPWWRRVQGQTVVAFTSVVVTGAIGMISIWQSRSQTLLNARQQNAQLRAELVQGDRAELRDVLDTAAQHLATTRSQIVLRGDQRRLELRLGPSQATTAFRQAADALWQVRVSASAGDDAKSDDWFKKFAAHRTRFVHEAHKLSRSILR